MLLGGFGASDSVNNVAYADAVSSPIYRCQRLLHCSLKYGGDVVFRSGILFHSNKLISHAKTVINFPFSIGFANMLRLDEAGVLDCSTSELHQSTTEGQLSRFSLAHDHSTCPTRVRWCYHA